MNRHELKHLDLGLLVVFEALMSDPHVTRVAERLHMTQPAVSAALRRLRRYFGEPLFVPAGRSLQATAGASRLLGKVQPALDQITAAVADSRPPHPAESRPPLRIALPEELEIALLPRLLRHLGGQESALQLRSVPLQRQRTCAQLTTGELAAVIDYDECLGADLPAGLQRLPLGHCDLLAVQAARPAQALDLAQFCARPQIDLSSCQALLQRLDHALAQQRQLRQVQQQVAHCGYLLPLLQASPCLAVLPAPLAQQLASLYALHCTPLPVALPAATLSLTWSTARSRLPDEQWLRQQISAALGQEVDVPWLPLALPTPATSTGVQALAP
ncbi:LysR family transcriptional regulator [Pseudomonas sp. SH1-B]